MAQWSTVQPSLEPILAPVNAVIQAIDSVLAALIAILNVVQFILNIVKAFLLGLLNPLRAIIEAIIAEIRAIIADLRQLGLYIHAGDIDLIDVGNQFQDIRGGFNGYSRRMIARLVDKSDPGRPGFSSSSAVVALFVYVSGEDVDALIRVLVAVYDFLTGKRRQIAAYPQPTALVASYGSTDLTRFRDLAGSFESGTPTKAVIKWSLPPGPGPGSGFKMPVPAGWLIEISTSSGGLKVVSVAPDDANSSNIVPSKLSAVAIDPVTNAVLEAFGAFDVLDAAPWEPVNVSDPHAPNVFVQKDTVSPPIPFGFFDSDKRAEGYFGKAYYLPNPGIPVALPGQTFSVALTADMMPKDADVYVDSAADFGVRLEDKEASVFFVRVRAVSKSVKEALGSPRGGFFLDPIRVNQDTSGTFYLYEFTPTAVRQSKVGRFLPVPPTNPDVGASDWGVASQPLEVLFPSASAAAFLETLEVALLVAILTRSDLPVSEDEVYKPGFAASATGLEEAAQTIFPAMGITADTFNTDPVAFRRTLRRKVIGFANDLFRIVSPSTSLIDTILDVSGDLLEWKWSDASSLLPGLTIGQSFGIGSVTTTDGNTPKQAMADPSKGVAPTISAIPRGATTEYGYMAGWSSSDRGPGFMTSPAQLDSRTPKPGGGSGDKIAPVVYSDTGFGGDFVRNLLTGTDAIGWAAAVLQTTAAIRPPKDGSWIAVRPFADALAPLDELLVKIESFLLGILDALQGIIDQIIAYIEKIQARIYQLQALIEMIRALLAKLQFELPSFSGLVTVANGTDGILQDFITADSKPDDSPSDLGAGLVVLAGGLPNILLELLAALFSGGAVDE